MLGLYLDLLLGKLVDIFSFQSPGFWDPSQFVHLIYCDRMRTVEDKQMVSSA